jgi:hypothetical protein
MTLRKSLYLVGLAVVVGASVFLVWRLLKPTPSDEKICFNGQCLNSMIVAASFDALPVDFRKELETKYFPEDAPATDFEPNSQGQLVAKRDGVRDVFQSTPFQKIAVSIERDGIGFLDPLWSDLSRARSVEFALGPACDISKPGRLTKHKEQELRRCVRSAYLLQAVPEFNERTQKLFGSVKVKYANGATGPLSLKREGLTDADRKMVLREVAKIDAKARSLGGFR